LEEGANILEQKFQISYSSLGTPWTASLDDMYSPDRQWLYARLVKQRHIEHVENERAKAAAKQKK